MDDKIYKMGYWNILKLFISVWRLHDFKTAVGFAKYAYACGRIKMKPRGKK